MRRSKVDPEILQHLEWLGFVRPTGLVVSAPALVRAGAILDRRDTDGQNFLRECVQERTFNPKVGPEPFIPDFQIFAQSVLGWSFSAKGYCGTQDNPIPEELSIPIPDFGETLRPDFAVREPDPKEGASPWQLLVQVLEPGEDMDRVGDAKSKLDASPHSKLERLLRATKVPAGVLFNGRTLRLVSAPYGESSGWLDFQVANMVTTGGRPICAALRLLLGQTRLLALPQKQRLAALLDESRKFQNEVSERLAEQVLHALYELLRGFQSAHDASKGELLKEVLEDDPDRVYRALLTVILRVVFLLYAEERDMLPQDETWVRYYSLGGLHERLREDAALHPDTMDQRFGAWAQLLVLFRMVYDGAEYGDVQLPKRHGDLFDPERFPFLEGRTDRRQPGARFDAPLVPDGTIYRALEKLLVLDGERLSYRALDVEQIGSVYETMMGFRIETATGRSIAIRAEKKHGAPSTIDLEALLAEPGAKREKWLQENAGRKLSDSVKKGVKEASTLHDLHAALDKVIDKRATPDIVPKGSLILQPSAERRRSGSHYTPRSLTEPIVRTTLEPILARLSKEASELPLAPGGERGLGGEGSIPTPEQLLDLKVCDPAMGSGAFLVETCRQLADHLVAFWRAHGVKPEVPPDEDEVIYARRLIAQRCLYGVDRNPMAVDLAKVSLWLVTLAKDHAFTFLDHSLKCGDSLVGLDREQLAGLHWKKGQKKLGDRELFERIAKAVKLRQEIALAGELDYDELEAKLAESEAVSAELIAFAGALVSAYFKGKTPAEREAHRQDAAQWISACLDPENHEYNVWERGKSIYEIEMFLKPFHWEFEFPEVFFRSNVGFDAIVGNPPFAGRTTTATSNPPGYGSWLLDTHVESHGNADLVAHFFRRALSLLRKDGAFGLIATNTVGQGDTRATGLRWICESGADIYSVRKRLRWPGRAAVVVSIVHVAKGKLHPRPSIDGRTVERITAYLFHQGGNLDPKRLGSNVSKSFQGSVVVGVGFTFDDSDTSGIANRLKDREALIAKNPVNAEVIFPYLGGEELNANVGGQPNRFIINLGRMSEAEARSRYPEVMEIVQQKVLTERSSALAKSWSIDKQRRVDRWWQFARPAEDLYHAIVGLTEVYALSQTSKYLLVSKVPANLVFSNKLVVFPFENNAPLSVLQSQIHEAWAGLMGSSMKDDPVYTPTDCFETFPFPRGWESDQRLEAVGQAYYEFRAALMIRNNEGLTKTYNRFHDPEERDPDILRLRELHAEMDRAVLDAYGWTDIPTDCEFILDYEEDEEESSSRRKKPWRYRWPDDVRDEVLARLLELNAKRAKEEELAGLTEKGKGKQKKIKDRSSPSPAALDFGESG